MKILIIKLGLSETLDPEIGRVSSLGDVLRTTPILSALKEKYPESKIKWVVDEAAYPLLHGNKAIDDVLIWDSFVGFQLMSERFDILINLEKIPGLCALSNKINAWKKYGFRFDETTGSYQVFDGAEYAMQLCTDKNLKFDNNKIWQEVLIEMIGGVWACQPYSLGYRPLNQKKFDVGFNIHVGAKFPDKAWPVDKWRELEVELKNGGHTVSWQEGLSDIYRYIDWISSCKVLVSSDSLGLHIALALNIPVLGLFGPTNCKEVYFYGNSKAIQRNHMDDIKVQEVASELKQMITLA